MDELKLKGRRFAVRKGKLWMELEEGEKPVQSMYLCLKRTGASLEIPMKMKRKAVRGKTVLFGRVDPEHMEYGYYELKAGILENGNKRKVPLRIINREIQIRQTLLPVWLRIKETGSVLYPYINAGSRCMLMFRSCKPAYDTKRFLCKDMLALMVYFLLKPWLDRKKYWLICEKNGQMAQENGYYFFKYCMEQLPQKERKRIFFAIDPASPDAARLQSCKKQTVDFMSFRYLVMLHAAELLIGSETKMMFYELDTINTPAKILYRRRKPNVFLQHGVMGLKQCHEGLHKNHGNRCSLFVTSSEKEKEIIHRYFGYDEDEILVTGLPRWDAVEDHTVLSPREILLMPTWRSWLEGTEDRIFTESEYYHHYQTLLKNEELEAFLEKRDLRLIFYAHPKFREYQKLFSSSQDRIRLIFFGETPLNELMMRCSLMITDYSSACWDVYRQRKPVIFDQFDREMYEKYTGAYMDLENGLFGDRAASTKDLLRLLEEYADRDFREKEVYGEMRKELLPLSDHDNSRRVYEEICRHTFESGLTAAVAAKIRKKIRKNKTSSK